MKRIDAFEVYANVHPQVNKQIETITKWDKKKTFKQNCIDVGMSYGYARNFQKIYGLKYKKVNIGSGRPCKNDIKHRAIRLLRNNMSYHDIGTLFGFSRQRAEQIIKSR